MKLPNFVNHMGYYRLFIQLQQSGQGVYWNIGTDSYNIQYGSGFSDTPEDAVCLAALNMIHTFAPTKEQYLTVNHIDTRQQKSTVTAHIMMVEDCVIHVESVDLPDIPANEMMPNYHWIIKYKEQQVLSGLAWSLADAYATAGLAMFRAFTEKKDQRHTLEVMLRGETE